MEIPALSSNPLQYLTSLNLRDIENIQAELTCPVTLETLTESIILYPCGHRIQKTALAKLQNLNCPLCRRALKAYQDDLKTRSLCEKLPPILEALKQLNQPPVQKPLSSRKCEAYPFLRATFKRVDHHSTSQLHFQSERKKEHQRPIDEIHLEKDRNGKLGVCISLKWGPEARSQFKRYLRSYGFSQIISKNNNEFLQTSDQGEAKKLIEILTQNNQFSETDLIAQRLFLKT